MGSVPGRADGRVDGVGPDRHGAIDAESFDRAADPRRQRRGRRQPGRGGDGQNQDQDGKSQDALHSDLPLGPPQRRPWGSRTNSQLITETWPVVAGRLLAFLHSRGVRRAVAEDIVQDVAARLLTADPRFSSADDLFPWAVTAARNLAVDAWRAEARLHAVAEVGDGHDRPAVNDVSSVVEHRPTLQRVGLAMARLSTAEREAIISGLAIQRPADPQETNRLAVRRHRARARLLAMVDGAAAFIGGLVKKVHRA